MAHLLGFASLNTCRWGHGIMCLVIFMWLCDGLITRPEGPFRLLYVWVWSCSLGSRPWLPRAAEPWQNMQPKALKYCCYPNFAACFEPRNHLPGSYKVQISVKHKNFYCINTF